MAVRHSRCESAAARMYASKGCSDSLQALPGRAETFLVSEKNQSRLVCLRAIARHGRNCQ